MTVSYWERVIGSVLSDSRRVRLFTAVSCLALSFFSFLSIDIVGRDGVVYLQTARVFVEQGFLEAFKVFNWPFYSIIIGFFHSLTGLSIEHSGYFLNTLLLLILTNAFVSFYEEINPRTKKLWVASVAVLAYAGLNDYRVDIIRGWGFIAFSLMAFLHFARFSSRGAIADALLWQIFIISAAAFRVESIVYMLFVPIWLVTFAVNKSIKKYLWANSVFIPAGIIVLAFIERMPSIRERVSSYLSEGGGPLESFSAHVAIFADTVLNQFSQDYAFTILVSGIAIMIVFKILTKLGLFYAAVGVVGLLKHGFPKEGQFRLVVFLLAISYVLVLLYFSKTLVMTGRYVLLSTLLALVLVAYYLEKWLQFLDSSSNKAWFYFGFCFPIMIMLISGVVNTSGNSKYYIKEAGNWTKNNLPRNARLLTNDRRLQYYSGLSISPESNRLQKAEASFMAKVYENYDYLLLRDKREDKLFDQFVLAGRLHIEKEFSNDKGARAVLYRIAKLELRSN